MIWGALHGLFLIGERLVRQYVWDFTKVRNVPARAMLAISTFGLFAFAAVLFRASSIGQAGTILTAMLSPWTHSALVPFEVSMVAIAAGAAMVGAQIRYGHLRGWDWLESWSVTPRAASIAVALLAVVLSPGLNPAFIYFQF